MEFDRREIVMNRFFYINEIYKSFRWSKKLLTKTAEKEVKKEIEKWLMYEYETMDGGKPQKVECQEGGVYLGTYEYTFTLADAAERVLRHLKIYGKTYYAKYDFVKKWVKKKKNRKLLKLK